MRAIQLVSPSLNSFVAADLPEPSVPGHGQILVAVRAASLNYIDVAVAQGHYPGIAFPLVPVADGAGEILAVGEGVHGLVVGDRVALHPKARWPAGRATAERMAAMRGVSLPGVLVEVIEVDASSAVKAPDHLGWEAIAALPVVATTAWNALEAAHVGPGSTVVVLGTGGTSLTTLQLAKARGARVIVTSSSDDKLARARALGADEGINYRAQPAWDEGVLRLTGGIGADLVLETAGPQTFMRSLAAARQGGTVFTIGFLSGTVAEVDLLPVIVKSLRVQGNNTGSAEDLADALRAIAAHRIEPVVDRVYPSAQVADAYRALAGGGHFGKLAIALT
ncbi:zinc-dependent alcohol dehydrogenase family protein [Frateuria defendens]|uniref:zinc-dependent alcohol dehydrogenase family protein n=1 Tax=Frateuria defendens TaxID=2219559 RepID=UPI00066FFA2B|nr:NAD(P)-dependent alcohol dehydrogenase [Frateuria defendens]